MERSSAGEWAKRPFTMPFQPATIEHLGHRLYSQLPAVIAELVSNSFDAESPKVEIQVPEGRLEPSSEIIVRDYGHGLDADEIQDEYLPISRFRRGKDAKAVLSKNKKRRVTGRKGIGKLSGFGIAAEMDVRAIKNREAICLRLNYEEIQNWPTEHGPGDYEPTLIADRTGSTKENAGLEVTLRGLTRKTSIKPDQLRRQLARRLDLISPESGFEVIVNGIQIGIDDKMTRSVCVDGLSWDLSEIPGDHEIAGQKLSGWIGFVAKSSQVDRGVNIMAHKKAVELNSYFNYPSTDVQFARSYLAGVVHADFLDEEHDLTSTARNTVVWEHELGQALESWGHAALRWVFDQWRAYRQQIKEKNIRRYTEFDDWLQHRAAPERRIAERMLDIIVKDDDIEPESAEPLLEIVKSSVESVYFHDLVDRIERQEDRTDTTLLLNLFKEWRVIEARAALHIADGRLSAIDLLEDYIKHGALEVQEMQPLFRQHPWLVDTKWQDVDFEKRYSELLEQHCSEPADFDDVDRRVDIFGVQSSGIVTVVEIKRPELGLARKHLEQIERYVDWARSQFLATGENTPSYVKGVLVVGRMSRYVDVQEKVKRLAKDGIRVDTYEGLYKTASNIYGLSRDRLKAVAPEYTREARQSGAAKN